jgi:iron(III) transport system substrate-binding protein
MKNKKTIYLESKKLFLGIALAVAIFLIISVFLFGTPKEEKKVIVYVSHDQDISEPILKEFEKSSGIKVEALYDTEATKTVGLVNRLIVEKSNPRAEVFWNNEVIRSILLKNENVLQPYCSPNANDIPSIYKDKDCYWTGFAARARVILYNTEKISEKDSPNSLYDFTNPKWKGKACISNPLLGTGSALTAALFASLGDENAKEFYLKMKDNGVSILESPSMVRDQVVSGECWLGSLDTDDAHDALVAKKPVIMVFPDQDKEGMGTVLFPNSVMMIKGAPHPEEAKKLIDFILTSKVEEQLAESAMQIPLKANSSVPENIQKNIKQMDATYEQIYEKLNVSSEFIQEVFLR